MPPISVSNAARPAPPLVDLSPTTSHARLAPLGRWRGRILRIGIPLLILLAWQGASRYGWIAEEVLPSPGTIADAFLEIIHTGDLQAALPISLWRASIGLLIGGGLGLFLGLFAGLWKLGEEIFDAPLQMLRTIPFIALIPLFITWFGIDESAKLAVIIAASIFPLYLNTYAGVRGVDHKLIEAGTVFGLTRRALIARVILPVALPSILVGLRYSAGIAFLALVVAEQINARSGIGYILVNANQNQRSDLIIVGIIVYAVLGVLIDLLMRAIEYLALPWRKNVAFT